MKNILLILLICSLLLAGCLSPVVTKEVQDKTKMIKENQSKKQILQNKNLSVKKATFAGGCFWCMEAAYEGLPGVIDVVSGYAGGKEKNPTYSQVASGKTTYREAIQITYDSKKTSYQTLLDFFWKQIDPTDAEGQFVDRGFQYTSAIFYHDEEQKNLSEQSKKNLAQSGKFDKPIATSILPYTNFYLAEQYHQDYSKKRQIQYKIYENGSGRPKFKQEVWKN